MKLPNAEQAIVEMSRLVDYCLSSTHFRGRNKARVFQSALGLTVDDAIELQEKLKQAAATTTRSKDMPEKGLVRGQIGTVVEAYSPTVGEVEFCDSEGRTYALETLSSDLLIRLYDRPLDQVA